jgi:hypothetical protein
VPHDLVAVLKQRAAEVETAKTYSTALLFLEGSGDLQITPADEPRSLRFPPETEMEWDDDTTRR